MTKPFMAILLLFYTCTTNAQEPVAAFGKVDKSELEIKNCDFEPNAEAIALIDEGEFYCTLFQATGTLNMSVERRTRIKVLNDKGLDQANIHIRYHSFQGDETVKNLTAFTYNLSETGNVVATKLEKKSVFDRSINKWYSELVFTMPDVKVGSVIEFKYTINNGEMSQWYFQRSIPVKYSHYKIDFPYELEIQCVPFCAFEYDRKTDPAASRNIETFTMRNVPALREEPHITCETDYLQRVETRLVALNFPGSPRRLITSSWPKLVKSLMEDADFGLQLKKNIPRTADLDSMLKKISDPYSKMYTIYNYVRGNMTWTDNDNIWALEGVKSAWKDKKGTTGEINLILVNLLKDAGLNAHPVLVSTRAHGAINNFMPSVRQFNKVMAFIELDGQQYVLNATEKFTPFNLIPPDVITRAGLVIEKFDTFEWGWRSLDNPKAIYKNSIYLSAAIDDKAELKGTAIVNSFGYARTERMPAVTEGKTAYTKTFLKKNPSMQIDSVTFDNQSNDTLPLLQNIHFSQALNGSGDYNYFNINLFTGIDKNPFVADQRFSDVSFGYKQNISIVGSISIPDSYSFEELPKNIRMMMPDTGIVFTRLAAAEGNEIQVRLTIEFKKPIYSAEEYPEFREFYKKLFDLLNEQIVIKKKR